MAARTPKVALPAPEAWTAVLEGWLPGEEGVAPLPPVAAGVGVVAAGPEGRGTVPLEGRLQPEGAATPEGHTGAEGLAPVAVAVTTTPDPEGLEPWPVWEAVTGQTVVASVTTTVGAGVVTVVGMVWVEVEGVA